MVGRIGEPENKGHLTNPGKTIYASLSLDSLAWSSSSPSRSVQILERLRLANSKRMERRRSNYLTQNLDRKALKLIVSISNNSFVNRDDLDFDNAESTAATQEWDLVEDTNGQVAEYSTRLGKSYSLCLFFIFSKSACLILMPL